MITCNLGQNTSPNNQLDKTVLPLASLSGQLREETSIIDPVIIVQGDVSSLAGANYMEIPDFGRSYYITNVTSYRTGLVQITAHVDVLASFAAQIRANSAIVSRQENKWNLMLNDGSLRAYQDPTVQTFPFPAGFSGGSYVLAVAGG